MAAHFFETIAQRRPVSPAGGGTPVDLQEWFEVGVGTLTHFYKKKIFKKQTGVPTPNSSQLGGGFACPRQRGIRGSASAHGRTLTQKISYN